MGFKKKKYDCYSIANQGHRSFNAKNVKDVFNGETVVAETDIKVKLEVKNRPSQYQHDSRAVSSQEESEPERKIEVD